jgi:hypothetical protein
MIAFSEIHEKRVKTHSVRKLYPCVIVSLENRSCGGGTTLVGARGWRKHTCILTDGQLTIEKAGFERNPRTCADKIVKR